MGGVAETAAPAAPAPAPPEAPAPERPATRGGANLAGAIYGTITVMAVLVGVSFDRQFSAGDDFEAVLGSSLVLWIAHVYAEALGERIARPEARLRTVLAAAVARDWPLAQVAIVPLLVLLLGVAGVLTRTSALNAALGVGIVNLFAWGLALGRSLGAGPVRTGLVGLVNIVLGIGMVVLKNLVH